MALVVEVQDLVKDYNGFKAVDGVTFHVAQGEIFGLLGPNGAGKTTTILMLLGMTEPTAGVVRVCGYDPNKEPLEVKRITGYLPENVGFYEDLTAKENLLYLTKLNGIPEDVAIKKIDEVLTTVGLLEVKDKLVGTYSKGMRQRLGLASVLIKEPKLVILDEPTTGIDPEGTEQVLDPVSYTHLDVYKRQGKKYVIKKLKHYDVILDDSGTTEQDTLIFSEGSLQYVIFKFNDQEVVTKIWACSDE